MGEAQNFSILGWGDWSRFLIRRRLFMSIRRQPKSLVRQKTAGRRIPTAWRIIKLFFYERVMICYFATDWNNFGNFKIYIELKKLIH